VSGTVGFDRQAIGAPRCQPTVPDTFRVATPAKIAKIDDGFLTFFSRCTEDPHMNNLFNLPRIEEGIVPRMNADKRGYEV